MYKVVLQGGGAIGAFQAGAFKALYEGITREDKENGTEWRPLFDIIAGTSVGAINAAVLVSHVIENKTWRGSAEKLVKFWEYLSWDGKTVTTNGYTQVIDSLPRETGLPISIEHNFKFLALLRLLTYKNIPFYCLAGNSSDFLMSQLLIKKDTLSIAPNWYTGIPKSMLKEGLIVA